MIRFAWLFAGGCVGCLALSTWTGAAAQQSATDDTNAATALNKWIREQSVPLTDLNGVSPASVSLRARFDRATVIGLGEATHGQHESFEAKRQLTMHLIEHRGYRVVAYESSASASRRCDDYISGRSDSIDAGMSGFDMMIWDIEENARLLEDLRAWNAKATASEQVRFVGIDLQDVHASSSLLAAQLAHEPEHWAMRAHSLAQELDRAESQFMNGSPELYNLLIADARSLVSDLAARMPTKHTVMFTAQELLHGIQRSVSPGARDAGMADLLLRTLAESGPAAKIVVWAHNAHIAKGPMTYRGVAELAMGGHVATALKDRYIAVGFAFGNGSFGALDRDENERWGFRTYTLDDPPEGSLERPLFEAVHSSVLLNLHPLPDEPSARAWMTKPLGHRWFGGYNVPADIRARTRSASDLMPATLSIEYDMLAFLPSTTPSNPRDASRRLKPIESRE